MRYLLIFFCNECGKRAQGFLDTQYNVVPPKGWAFRRKEAAAGGFEDLLACSSQCVQELNKKHGSAVIVPSSPLWTPPKQQRRVN